MSTLKHSIRRIPLLFILPFIVLLFGIIGFMILEQLSFLDSLYLTLVTISTVGYGDVHPVSTAGKIFALFLIIFGIGVFLAIITSSTQMVVQRGRDRLRRQRLNMIIGVFFSEMGNTLLRLFVEQDSNIENIREEFSDDTSWDTSDIVHLHRKLVNHQPAICLDLPYLETISGLLRDNSDLLLRQLENPDLIEHEAFTELLWATVHLRDELMYRENLSSLPDSDLEHLRNDINRIYSLLTRQWLNYLVHLKRQYPYLYSLAMRTNPFVTHPSVIIE